MSKWTWYVNRLKAMNLQELVWRLEQKKIQMKEKRRFGSYKVAVSSFRFNKTLEKLRFDCDALGIIILIRRIGPLVFKQRTAGVMSLATI